MIYLFKHEFELFFKADNVFFFILVENGFYVLIIVSMYGFSGLDHQILMKKIRWFKKFIYKFLNKLTNQS